MEIVVVDDGSRDETAKVARDYGVQVITHDHNSGLSVGRNTGLAVARGDVLVATDDDCIASPTLLAELAKGYAEHNPVGVGSCLKPIDSANSLVERYMNAAATGPATMITGSSRGSFVRRLWNYVGANFKSDPVATTEKTVVRELYGANGSFPTDVLREVGGWDPEMSGIEDRDLCHRISQRHPDRDFYFMPAAHMVHAPDISLRRYLMRPYTRGPKNVLFHRRNHIAPPIFPGPPTALLAVASAALLSPWLVLPAAFVVPQALYCWWPYRALRERECQCLVFSYLQLAEETMVLAGLVRGWLAGL